MNRTVFHFLAATVVLSACVARADDVTIVAFGDSTTATRGNLVIYPMLLEKDLPGKGIDVRVVNAGIGGNDTNMARARFSKDVLAHEPDIVIIQFGINDSSMDVWRGATRPRVDSRRYVANLQFFIKTLKSGGAKVILMTPNPLRWTDELRGLYGKPPYQVNDAEGFNVLLSKYAELARSLARLQKIPLIDVYAAFGAYGKQPGQSVDDLLLDGMHPNAKGHRIIADLLVSEITGK